MGRPSLSYAESKARAWEWLKDWIADHPASAISLRAIKGALRNKGKDSLYEALLRDLEREGIGRIDRELGILVKTQ